MIRALLAGTKTQTRRIVKIEPENFEEKPAPERAWIDTSYMKPEYGNVPCLKMPYGAEDCENRTTVGYCPPWEPGDHLWVRETCGRKPASFLGIETTNGVESAFYAADGAEVVNEDGFNLCPWWNGKTCASIHMPRWASRITLDLLEVRVERLQDISEEDAIAEGVEHEGEKLFKNYTLNRDGFTHPRGGQFLSARDSYLTLWESINGPKSWDLNPWVWPLSFPRL